MAINLKFWKKESTKEPVLLNRGEVNGGIAGQTSVVGKAPSDPIASLTLDKIDSTYRREVNTRGIYLNAAYALEQLSQIVPPVKDKLNFWQSQISSLDWEVKTIENADKAKADKQREIVLNRFNRIANLKRAIKHLALFRFYGFSTCKIYDDSLATVNPWSVSRNVQWVGSEPPDYDYYLNALGNVNPNFKQLEKIESPNFAIVESDQSLLLALLRLAFKYREQDDAWDGNLSKAGRNQLIIQTPPMSNLSEEQKTRLGLLLESLSDGQSGWLEMLDGQTENKITRIEPPPAIPHYKDRLTELKNDITSLIASSTLNNGTGATGLGSNVAESHAETLKALVMQDALSISEALDAAITVPVLLDAGLIAEGETPLVYFQISQRKENDAKGALELAKMARDAGKQIPTERLSEMTGMELEDYSAPNADPFATPAVPQPAEETEQPEQVTETPAATVEPLNGAQVTSLVGVIAEVTGGKMPLESAKAIIQAAFPAISEETLRAIISPLEGFKPALSESFQNRETERKVSEYLTENELENIDKSLLQAIENLAAKFLGDEAPIDEKWISDLQEAIKKLTPDLVSVEDIQKRLEEEMTNAAKGAIAAKVGEAVAKKTIEAA